MILYRKTVIKLLLSAIIFLMIGGQYSSVKAQTDTLKPIIISFHAGVTGFSDTAKMDTMLSPDFLEFHNYFNRYLAWNGNQGSAIFPLTFTTRIADKNEYTQHLAYDPAIINNVFYNTIRPFSTVSFFNNSSKPIPEQTLRFLHTQNINPDWNLGFSGTLAGSTGKYAHQANKNNSFRAFTRYTGKYYSGYLNYNFAKHALNENGGIADISQYTDSLLPPENIPVKLATASNVIKYRNVVTHHEITLSSFGPLVADSSRKSNRLILGGAFEFNRFRRLYSDTPEGFYTNLWLDSLKTADSTQISRYKTSLYLKADLAQKFVIFAGGFFERRDYGMYEIHHREDVPAFYGGMEYHPGKIQIHTDFDFHLADEDNHLESEVGMVLPFKIKSQTFNLIANASYATCHPQFFDDYYLSNHFFWINSFSSITNTKIEAGLEQPDHDGSLLFTMNGITNPVYYDTTAMPHQFDGSSTYMSVSGKYHFKLGKWHWAPQIVFQSQSDSVLQELPAIITNQSVYYGNRIFKVLDFTIGADVFYCSSFYGPAYMPATMTYYQQNTLQTGDYPVASVFLGLKLKKARFLIKVHHINDGVTKRKNMLVAGYPLPDRYFTLGISWNFYN